jgi:hypothetical protein
MMLRRTLAGLMLRAAGLAHAEWTSDARHNDGEFFIDRATIKTKGSQREVWSMMNYSNPQMSAKGTIHRSNKSLLQVDSDIRYARAIHMSFFTDLKLRGDEFGKMGSLPPW